MQAQSHHTHSPDNHASSSTKAPARARRRLGRPFIAALACGATLLGVTACGGSGPKTMTPAAKAFLVSTAEQAGASSAQATEVVNCMDPALQAHGITTIAAAKSANANTQGNEPEWLSATAKKCATQLVSGSAG